MTRLGILLVLLLLLVLDQNVSAIRTRNESGKACVELGLDEVGEVRAEKIEDEDE